VEARLASLEVRVELPVELSWDTKAFCVQNSERRVVIISANSAPPALANQTSRVSSMSCKKLLSVLMSSSMVFTRL
jgi:hypothetical protein